MAQKTKKVKIKVENGMENQGFPMICTVKGTMKYLKK